MTLEEKLEQLENKYGIETQKNSQATPSASVSNNGKAKVKTKAEQKLEQLESKYGIKTETVASKTPTVNNVKTAAASGTSNVNQKMAQNKKTEVPALTIPRTTAQAIDKIAQAAAYADIMARKSGMSIKGVGNNAMQTNKNTAKRTLPSIQDQIKILQMQGGDGGTISNGLPSGTDISKPIEANTDLSSAGKRAAALVTKGNLNETEINELGTYINAVQSAINNGQSGIIPSEDLLPNGTYQKAYDRYKTEKYLVAQAGIRKFLEGIGAESAVKTLNGLTGNTNDEALQEYDKMKEIAVSKAPAAAQIGQMAGTLALANAVGKIVPAAAPAAAKSAIQWGTVAGAKNVGKLATGEISEGEFVNQIIAESGASALGTAASGQLASDLSKTALGKTRSGSVIISGLSRGTYVAGTDAIKRALQEAGLGGEKQTAKDVAIDTLFAVSLGVAEEGAKILASDINYGLSLDTKKTGQLKAMADSIPDDRKYYESDAEYEKAMNLKNAINTAWNRANETTQLDESTGIIEYSKVFSVEDGMKIRAAADGIDTGNLQYAIYRNAYDAQNEYNGQQEAQQESAGTAIVKSFQSGKQEPVNAENVQPEINNAAVGQEEPVKEVKGLEKPSTIGNDNNVENEPAKNITEGVKSLLKPGEEYKGEESIEAYKEGLANGVDDPNAYGLSAAEAKAAKTEYEDDAAVEKELSVLEKYDAEVKNAKKNTGNSLQLQEPGETKDIKSGMSEDEIKKSIENIKDEKIENVTDTDLKLYIPSRDDENLDIPEQMKKYAYKIEGMHPVANITGNTEKLADEVVKTSYAKRAIERWKNGIVRSNLGRIILAKGDLNSKIRYGASTADILAFDAIEDVIKKGIVISGHYNHDNRNISTLTIAAPVTINGKTGNMAVVIKNIQLGSNKNVRENRYKIHRVLTPDGKILELDEADSGSDRRSLDGKPSPTESASNRKIPQNKENSNSMKLENPKGGENDGKNGSGEEWKTDLDGYRKLSEKQREEYRKQISRREEIKDLSGTSYHEAQSSEVIANGTNKGVRVASQEFIDKTDWAKSIVNRNEERGVKTTLVFDNIELEEDGEPFEARAYVTDNGKHIIINANNDTFTAEQLNDHEWFHNEVSSKPELMNDIRKKLYGYTDEQLEEIAIEYADAYDFVDDIDSVLAEIYSDIYADMVMPEGVNVTEDFSKAVNESASETKEKLLENGINTVEYPAGNEEARAEKLRDVKGAKFSRELKAKKNLDLLNPGENSKKTESDNKEKSINLSLQHPDDIMRAEKARQEDMDAAQAAWGQKVKEEKKAEPNLAIRDLKKDVQRIFSLPQKGRGEINAKIEELGQKMLKDGKITSADRDQILETLYESGSVAVDVETDAKVIRDMLAGRKIYVPEYVRQEYGEDWTDLRRKLFRNRIYLTSDKSNPNVAEVAGELNGIVGELFDQEDEALALKMMEYYAEEGKPQTMNLYQEAQMQENMYGEGSGQEYLDDLAKNLDKTLEGFAYKAGIEVDIRDRINKEVSDRIEKQDISARNKQTMRDIKRLRKRMGMNDTKLSEAMDRLSPEDKLVAEMAIKNISTSAQRLTKKTMEKMQLSKEMYNAKLESDPNYIPDKATLDLLQEMDRDYLKEKTLEELSDIHRAITSLMTHLTDIDKEIGKEHKEKFEELFRVSSHEVRGSKGRKSPKGKIGAGTQKLIDEEQLTPLNFIEMVSGWDKNSTFYKTVGKQLEEGERAKKQIIVEMNDLVADFKEKNQEWISKSDGQGKDAEWIKLTVPSLNGYEDETHKPIFGGEKTVYVTPAMMVELARGARNDDNLRHAQGGVTFPDKDLYAAGLKKQAYDKGTTIKLAPETMKNTFKYENLDETGKKLFDLMDTVFDDYSKSKINATSQEMDGVDRAMTKHYSKIYTNKNFRVTDMTMDESIGGLPSLKTRVTSSNPMYAMSVWDAFNDNMDTVAKYAGMAIPLRNVQSLINWKQNGESMKDIISQKWGDGEAYIENLIKNMSNKHYEEKSGIEQVADSILSNYIGATFGLNPGIVLKQFASFPSAAAVLGFDTVPSIKQINNADPELIKKYTPELAYRSMGWSTAEIAELKNNPNWTQKNKVTRFIFGGAIQAMDYFTVKSMWPWAENYVKKYYPTFTVGSDAYYKKVADVFNRATAETQPMYDEMHRANIMKHSSPATRAFTLFKTVPMQQQNMIRKAYGEWKNSTGTEEKAKNGKAFGATILSLVLANVMFEGIEYLNQLWKNKGKNYRDEEGNLTAESVGTEMAKGVAEDFIGTLIGGDELVDAYKYLNGDSWKFEIDTPGLTQVVDLIQTSLDFGKDIKGYVEDVNDVRKNGGSVEEYLNENGEELRGTIKSMASELSLFLVGVPTSNLEKYIIGTIDWISPETAEEYQTWWENTNKTDLKGLSDEEMKVRVRDLTTDRFEISENSIDELCRLYKETETDAIPADLQSKVTINGEEITLSASQKQEYKKAYQEIADGSLEKLFASKEYKAMNDAQKADALQKLYNLSREYAKNRLGQEEESAVSNWKAAKESGLSAGTYIAVTSAMSFQKGADNERKVIKEADITGSQKLAIYANVALTEKDAQKEVIQKLTKEDDGSVFDLMYDLKLVEGKSAKVEALADSKLSTKGKQEVYYDLLVGSGETKEQSIKEEKEIVQMAAGSGIQFDEYLSQKAKLTSFESKKDADGNVTTDKQSQVIDYIKTQPESKWKALWIMAGYSENTFEKKVGSSKSSGNKVKSNKQQSNKMQSNRKVSTKGLSLAPVGTTKTNSGTTRDLSLAKP